MFLLVDKLNKARVHIHHYQQFAPFYNDDPSYTSVTKLQPVDIVFDFDGKLALRNLFAEKHGVFDANLRAEIHEELRQIILAIKSRTELNALDRRIEEIQISLNPDNLVFDQSNHPAAEKKGIRDFDHQPFLIAGKVEEKPEDQAREIILGELDSLSKSISEQVISVYKNELKKIKQTPAFRQIEMDLWLGYEEVVKPESTERHPIDISSVKPEYHTKFRERFKLVIETYGLKGQKLTRTQFNALFDSKSEGEKINWVGKKSHLAYLASKLSSALNIQNGYVVFSSQFTLAGESVDNEKLRSHVPSKSASSIPTEILELISRTKDLYTKG